jgi:hypothetical protein
MGVERDHRVEGDEQSGAECELGSTVPSDQVVGHESSQTRGHSHMKPPCEGSGFAQEVDHPYTDEVG